MTRARAVMLVCLVLPVACVGHGGLGPVRRLSARATTSGKSSARVRGWSHFSPQPSQTSEAGEPDHACLQGGPLRSDAISAWYPEEEDTFWMVAPNGEPGEPPQRAALCLHRVERTTTGTTGRTLSVRISLRLTDPEKKLPFAIAHHFTETRALTPADLNIVSLVRLRDGSFWLGDARLPSLIHVDATGALIEAPVPIPASDDDKKPVSAGESPMLERGSAIGTMNALATHARLHGARRAPIFSPWHLLIADGDPSSAETRDHPPEGSGLARASSEIFDMRALSAAGYDTVPWTVNDVPRMTALLRLGARGLISDRPDLLLEAARAFDVNGDGFPGDLIDADGLIDRAKLDAQGHRGARDLRPENTLPAFEVALDNLMSTLELDIGITRDKHVVVSHEPRVTRKRCRKAGRGGELEEEALLKSLDLAELQSRYVCDRVFRGPKQWNDLALSPVSVAYAKRRMSSPYAMPSLEQVFDFVRAYAAYYDHRGAGARHPEARVRSLNAARVRFSIETKVNPRAEGRDLTWPPDQVAEILGQRVHDRGLEDRVDVQSFDLATLIHVQTRHPKIRTVALFGDFPVFSDPRQPGSEDGANLQPEGEQGSPWLAGLPWPYRATDEDTPVEVPTGGGPSGLALTSEGARLLILMKAPWSSSPHAVPLLELDLKTRAWLPRYTYPFQAKTSDVGGLVLSDDLHGLVMEREATSRGRDVRFVLREIELDPATRVVHTRRILDLSTLPVEPRWVPALLGVGGMVVRDGTTLEIMEGTALTLLPRTRSEPTEAARILELEIP